jgi:hypothetical protein
MSIVSNSSDTSIAFNGRQPFHKIQLFPCLGSLFRWCRGCFYCLVRIIRSLHSRHITLANSLVIYNRFRIILPNDNPALLLDRQWCIPWFINILCGKVFELGQPLANIISVFVRFLTKCDRTVASKILVEMSSA